MVTDLNLDLQVIGMATVREADGLAMSSRNVYLKENERLSALTLIGSLKLAQNLYTAEERKAAVIIGEVEKIIKSADHTNIDYIKICDTTNLEDVDEIKSQAVIALAVKIGATRLIDNHVFGEELKA
jgi:pantoate--beta-alanine ligase